jgi:hypothetical protein
MKFYLYPFCLLTFIGLSEINSLNAQDQSAQTQGQASTVTSQSTQNTSVADSNRVQNQNQTQVVSRPKPFADELNIADQFSFAIDKSSNFQDYKVIKQTWMSKLKTNTLDTLLALKTNLKTSTDIIAEKTKTIETLRTELNSAQSDLLSKNSFKFFGIMVSKTGYDSIMWTIIIGLIVGLGFMIAAFRRAFAVTSQTKKDLLEAKDEFENYRKKALKSKEETVRQLYDELNKYKKMK